MGAAGCRKNANFGGDSNPWALDTLNPSINCEKKSENGLGKARTTKICMEGERSCHSAINFYLCVEAPSILIMKI